MMVYARVKCSHLTLPQPSPQTLGPSNPLPAPSPAPHLQGELEDLCMAGEAVGPWNPQTNPAKLLPKLASMGTVTDKFVHQKVSFGYLS